MGSNPQKWSNPTLEQLLKAGERILFGDPLWEPLWRNLERVGFKGREFTAPPPPPPSASAAPKRPTVRFMRHNYRTYEGLRGNPDEWRATFAAASAQQAAADALKSKSCFALLGVDPSATKAEIKSAYRRKVREAHPDHGGSAHEFQEITAAYKLCLLQEA